MAPDRPSTCVTRGRGSENPARAQGGITPWLTAGLHGIVACWAAGAGETAVAVATAASECGRRQAAAGVGEHLHTGGTPVCGPTFPDAEGRRAACI